MATKITANQILKDYAGLQEILLDKDLAGLGDMYVNLIYSLALSKRLQRPVGAKVNNRLLAEVVKRSGLRRILPRRIDRHSMGDAAEALIVFAWLRGTMSLDDCVKILEEGENPAEAFAELLREVGRRLGVEYG